MAGRSRRIFGLALVPLLLCGLIALAGLSLLAVAGVLGEVGPAAPDLSLADRFPLAVHLLARAPALDSAAGDPAASLELVVAEGSNAQGVIDQLVESGVVHDGLLLRSYLQYRGLDVGIQAGSYSVNGSMTIRELSEALQTARPAEAVLTILEGWRLEQVGAALDLAGLSYGSAEFLALVRTPSVEHPLLAELEPGRSLEGLLFPDTYRLEPQSGPEALVKAALDNFDLQVDADLREQYHAYGLTLYQAVTLASIVEREAVVDSERPLIAAVFLRRLRGGLPLEADPTVQYALGQQPDGGWWKAPLSFLDLEFDSPYNTYRYTGLPPGPISNPGLSALQSVGSPADTSYLYFRAACDGSGTHLFAETFEEHLANACP